MISFIKTLFGFGSKEVTPSAAPYKIEPATTTYIEPVKPVFKPEVVSTSAASSKKNRRPRNRNKAKASSVASSQKTSAAKSAITESKTNSNSSNSSNGAVKTHHTPAKVAKVKSTKPKHAVKSK
jgi:hypothetical protein